MLRAALNQHGGEITPGQPLVLPRCCSLTIPVLPPAAAGAAGLGGRGGSVCHAEAGGLCGVTAFCLLNVQVNPASVSERSDETGSSWFR